MTDLFKKLGKSFWVLAVVTAVILMAGGIRVHADEGKVLADEGKSVRVSTAKQLKAALKNDEVNVILFKTEAYLSDVTIKSVKGSEKKKLIIDTPNISIINKAMFAEVIIENAKGYTESISGNIITLSDAYIPEGLIVAKNKQVESLVICDDYFSQPFYMLRKGAQVKSVTLRAYSKEKEIPFNESRYNAKKRQLTIDFVNSYGVELTTVINLDKYGRFTKIQCLGDEIAEFGCNDTYKYDKNGNVLSIKGNNDVKNIYSGNMLKKREVENGYLEYTYDKKGRIIEVNFRGEDSIDGNTYPLSSKDSYVYDKAGRVVCYIHDDLESEYSFEEKNTYNSKGFLTATKTQSSGIETDYSDADCKQYMSINEREYKYKYNKAGDLTKETLVLENESKDYFFITKINDELFKRIKGKSFKDNCTVPKEDLRYLHVLHKDLDGKTHEGEMIVNYHIAEDVLDILRKLYEADYPIEKIRLVDEYDADDETSMRDNNSSSFNFRFISHTTRVSKHGLGLAVDINTLYNPYTKVVDGERIIEPATAEAYLDRNADFPYKIDENDLCYKLFIEKGFEWGGSWTDRKDYQHFEIPTDKIAEWYPENA